MVVPVIFCKLNDNVGLVATNWNHTSSSGLPIQVESKGNVEAVAPVIVPETVWAQLFVLLTGTTTAFIHSSFKGVLLRVVIVF